VILLGPFEEFFFLGGEVGLLLLVGEGSAGRRVALPKGRHGDGLRGLVVRCCQICYGWMERGALCWGEWLDENRTVRYVGRMVGSKEDVWVGECENFRP